MKAAELNEVATTCEKEGSDADATLGAHATSAAAVKADEV